MATQPVAEPLIPVEEYLDSIYHPDREYNHGVVEERHLGEFEHSFLQANLAAIFTVQAEAWGVFGLTEQRVQMKPLRYVIPDVTVLRVGLPREAILTRPPLITIEIMSPKDTMRAVRSKSEEYREFGVENIWVIDPQKRVVYRYADSGLEVVPSGELAVAGTPILVKTQDLFAKLDRF